MQTSSVMIQSLCVPCYNNCRYCLLSWDGRIDGSPWSRSVRLAERLLNELRTELPEINSQFSFGYSMEHPNLREAIRTLRRLGSPQAQFLQCDGMRMRSESQAALVANDTLMINPVDEDPVNHGGSFYFCKGQVTARIPFDQEDILIVDIS